MSLERSTCESVYPVRLVKTLLQSTYPKRGFKNHHDCACTGTGDGYGAPARMLVVCAVGRAMQEFFLLRRSCPLFCEDFAASKGSAKVSFSRWMKALTEQESNRTRMTISSINKM